MLCGAAWSLWFVRALTQNQMSKSISHCRCSDFASRDFLCCWTSHEVRYWFTVVCYCECACAQFSFGHRVLIFGRARSVILANPAKLHGKSCGSIQSFLFGFFSFLLKRFSRLHISFWIFVLRSCQWKAHNLSLIEPFWWNLPSNVQEVSVGGPTNTARLQMQSVTLADPRLLPKTAMELWGDPVTKWRSVRKWIVARTIPRQRDRSQSLNWWVCIGRSLMPCPFFPEANCHNPTRSSGRSISSDAE